MRVLLISVFTLLTFISVAHAEDKTTMPVNQTVKIETSLGDILVEIDTEKAPVSAKNFLDYVNSGFYDGTIFHRVIPDFMAQGGGFDTDFKQKAVKDPIKNEADNGLKNTRGSLAMARTPDPDSATAQFFINLKNNSFLDFKSKTSQGWGYAVFGRVIDGMDVVDKMAEQPTGSHGGHQDVPKTPIVIKKASVVSAAK
ncbi:MAG TPA: peptidyl-prolyl cis-trans isomerase [Crenotrichaceae bacterium]|nr:peptidyl-prolyl cis-trans isomerase [Crenotrichaceae bacterium]